MTFDDSRERERQERVRVFLDTLKMIRQDPELTGAVETSAAASRIYPEGDYPGFNRPLCNAVITVTSHRSLEAAGEMIKSAQGLRVAVLNFANAFTPGGGVMKGSSAQEESLCRCSTLYPVLDRPAMWEGYYRPHLELSSSLSSDAVIWSPGIVVCKSDTRVPQPLPREYRYSVDVLTAAAPDLRKEQNVYAELAKNSHDLPEKQLYRIHFRRAQHILAVAAANGDTGLILGAFGCGAFQNNPRVVAAAWKDAIDCFPPVFEQIEFAIFHRSRETENYDAFSSAFGCGE